MEIQLNQLTCQSMAQQNSSYKLYVWLMNLVHWARLVQVAHAIGVKLIKQKMGYNYEPVSK